MTRTIRHTLLIATLTLFAGAAAAESLTGSGRMATESRPVSGFSSVKVSVDGHLQLTQGNTESLTITADDNVLPYIETVVEEGQLKIRFRKPVPGEALNIKRVKISMKLAARNMEAIAVAGSGDIAAGPLKATRLVVNIAGSGNVGIESVEAEDMALTIGGSGDLAIRGGRTDSINVRIGGSGEVKAPSLASKRAKVRIGGSGDASLWVRDTLEVRIAGSGGLRYYGDPQVDRKVAGSGDVRRLGASPS